MTRVVYSHDPELRWDHKTEKWTVLRGFGAHWHRDGGYEGSLTVPAGFRTDLASVPRIARSIVPQIGRHLQAAIVHDWCLGREVVMRGVEMTEAEKHQLFLDGMASLGVPWLRRKIMYQAVRTWGWWKRLVR
jgi:hypothetical protein